jgi:3-hydroxybutyryl-CoA dehydrogenase
MSSEVIGVVGAGLMGGEIALVYALAGHRVLLNDVSDAPLAQARTRLADIVAKGLARGFVDAAQADGALDRLETTTDLARFAACDAVTEAVFEDVAVKTETWRRLDAVCAPSCLFASNTSTIPISTLAAAVAPARRRQFIGTHYFSPVSRMKLVEVIPAFDTSETTIESTLRLCRGAGKTPIRVKDVAGFAVNRALHAFVIEAVRLVEEGVISPDDFDTACRLGLGHAIGPFELMDQVSSSLCLQVQEILQDAYGERFRPPALLKQKVQAGHDGRKVGLGWRIPAGNN